MIQQGKKIYLCDLNLKPIIVLNGVKTDTVNCKLRVKDYSELTFDVDEYIIVKGKKQKSFGYDMLLPYMTLYLEDIGMFQMQKPTEQNDGNGETKSIVAYSLEKEFEDRNWINFKCNTGEKDSLEQIAENNLNELGYAKEFVTFYNKKKHDLSFIHLLLEKMPGWSVDDDDIDSLLWNRKIPSITQDNVNLYSLCCSYIATRMNLLFLFDTIHRKIKAVAKENLNDKKYESTVFITYRNLAQSVEIQTDEDSIFTRFNVRGDNDLNVLNCNYGDYYIYNLDYFTCHPYMSNTLQEKVKTWTKYRDDNRESYIQIAKKRADANQKLNDIIYRDPADDLDIKQWDNMNEDGLNESLKYYNSLITSLQVSVDPDWDSSNKDFSTYVPWKKSDGTVDHDRYLEKLKNLENGYGGYYTYYDILNYIIPNIEIAISNLNKTDNQKSEYVKDWETNWDLYGTIELDGLQKKYKTELETLEGYAKDWSDLTDDEKSNHSNNESNYNIYHKRYVEIYSYIGENGSLNTAINDRNKEKENAEATVNNYQTQMNDLKADASIDNEKWDFTEQEKITLYSLFHDEDYQNTNILSTSVDNSITEIDREKELFDDATDKLSEVAQPQYKFTVSMDNLYGLDEFKQWQGELKLLKFIRLGIRDDFAVKLRVVSISWNPCDVTDDLTVEFSNMITSRSGRSDLNELLDIDNNRGSQNSISFGTGNSDTEKEYLSSMLQQIIKMGAFKTAVGNIAGDTTANLSEAQINTLISNYIQVAKIKVGNIEGDKAEFNEIFTKYLDSDLISTKLIQGENGDFIDFVNSHLDFKSISAELLTGGNKDTFIDFVNNQIKTNVINTDLANIKNLLAGSAGIGDLQTIHLTANNAVIDEAVIKNLIAAKISVADLVAHTASAELITLISKDGNPSIAFKNSTQQFYDNNGNVRVQIGQDGSGDFNFIIRGEDGTTALFDSKGIKRDGIPENTIINNMIEVGTVSKDRLNFKINTNEQGGLDITEIYDGEGGKWGEQYTSFKNSTKEQITNITDPEKGQITTSISKAFFGEDGKSISDAHSMFTQTIEEIKTTISNNKADADGNIGNNTSSITQNANKISFMVTGDKESEFQVTDKFIQMISDTIGIKANNINIDGIITAMNTHKDSDKTKIDGGIINTNTVNAMLIATQLLKSKNYQDSQDSVYSLSGLQINMESGAMEAKNFAIDSEGNAYFKGNGEFSGKIIASSGQIADCLIEKGKFIVPFANISGTLQANQIAANSISADKLTSDNIVGTNGWINLANGTFDYGNGKFSWDGTSVNVEGKVKSTIGLIGCWTLDDDSIYRANKVYGASDGMYFGTSGLSISDKFKVTSDGVLAATGSNISGDINATSIYVQDAYYIYSGTKTQNAKIIWCNPTNHPWSPTQDSIDFMIGTENKSWINFLTYAFNEQPTHEIQLCTKNESGATLISCDSRSESSRIIFMVQDPSTSDIAAVHISSGTNGRCFMPGDTNNSEYDEKINLGISTNKWLQVYTKNLYATGDVQFSSLLEKSSAEKHIVIDAKGNIGWRTGSEGIYTSDGYGIVANYGGSPSASYKILPAGNGTYVKDMINLGSSGYKFASVWVNGGTCSGSDRNIKKNINPYNSKLEQAYMEFEPVSYMFKNFNETANHDRVHYGLIAQDIEKTLHKYGITNKEAGFLLIDELDEPNEAGFMKNYGLRYSEFISINMHMIQKAHHRINTLEQSLTIALCTIKSLQEEVSTLKQTIA